MGLLGFPSIYIKGYLACKFRPLFLEMFQLQVCSPCLSYFVLVSSFGCEPLEALSFSCYLSKIIQRNDLLTITTKDVSPCCEGQMVFLCKRWCSTCKSALIFSCKKINKSTHMQPVTASHSRLKNYQDLLYYHQIQLEVVWCRENWEVYKLTILVE